jgi:hypothetical protein
VHEKCLFRIAHLGVNQTRYAPHLVKTKRDHLRRRLGRHRVFGLYVKHAAVILIIIGKLCVNEKEIRVVFYDKDEQIRYLVGCDSEFRKVYFFVKAVKALLDLLYGKSLGKGPITCRRR